MIKTYTENIIEFEKVGYFDNNTSVIENQQTPYHMYETDFSVFTGITYYLYKLNESQLRLKEIDEALIDSYTGSNEGSKIYLDPQSITVNGVYRFHIIYNSVTVYTDIFCIKDISYDSIQKMKGGFLKFYKGNYFEFQNTGYFDNNTILKKDTQLSGYYFDSELTVNTILCQLYQINESKLELKTIDEHLIKEVVPSESEGVIYFNDDYFEGMGIYRYKTTVTPTVGSPETFYSDCFCVISPPQTVTSLAQFADETYIQFADGTFMEFTN